MRSDWKIFRELLPLLTSRVFSYMIKGKFYQACARSVILYGSDTWPLNAEDMSRITRTVMQIIR